MQTLITLKMQDTAVERWSISYSLQQSWIFFPFCFIFWFGNSYYFFFFLAYHLYMHTSTRSNARNCQSSSKNSQQEVFIYNPAYQQNLCVHTHTHTQRYIQVAVVLFITAVRQVALRIQHPQSVGCKAQMARCMSVACIYLGVKVVHMQISN